MNGLWSPERALDLASSTGARLVPTKARTLPQLFWAEAFPTEKTNILRAFPLLSSWPAAWGHENKISSSQQAPQMRAPVCLCTENLCSAVCPRNYRHDFHSRIVWQGTEACRKCSSWLRPMFSHCGILLIIKCSCYYYYCYRILNYSDLCNNQLTCDKRKCDVVLPYGICEK